MMPARQLLWPRRVVSPPAAIRRLVVVMWSPDANRAAVWSIANDCHPRELENVSMPAGSLLVLNRRYGQFISAVTGLTVDGHKPIGFVAPLRSEKISFGVWRSLYPETH